MNEMKNVVAVTVMVIALMAIIVPVSTALEEVEWECFITDEPITLGMKIIMRAETNPEDGSFVCVPVDRNIGLPKSELVKCECDIWSDIDDIDALSFLTSDTRYIWAKDCNDIKHCDCTEMEKYTLTLKHYQPYYKPGKDDPRRAGDLVATLIDKETKEPVPYIKVVFYVERDEKKKGENLCKVTREKILPDPYYERSSSFSVPNIEGIRYLLRFSKNKYLQLDSTDSKGKAKTNYIHELDLGLLSKELMRRGENGKIIGTIKAVALTQERLENKQEKLEDKKWKIECEESVDIELSSVARITKISVHNKDGKAKDGKGAILVKKVDEKIIAVYDKDYISQGKLSKKAKYTPYNLLRGDILLLNENDFIDVCWLTGTKMKITVKTGVLEKDQLAKVHIGCDDAGWYEWLNAEIRGPTMHIINLGMTGASIGVAIAIVKRPISSSFIASAGVVKTVACEAFALGFLPLDTYRNPLIIECYSTILIDFDETATVYTVEGTGRLYNKDKSTTDVTTGHKISVSPDGTFSQVTKFDRSELNEDLSYLLDEIEGKPHKPRPTLTPVSTPIPTPKPTPVQRSTSAESTPAREPTTQEECERWCSSRYGAGTPGMFFSIDGCACRCKEGYTTTAEGIAKISIEQCDQLCRDKFGTGSAGMFNSDEMCRCVCSEGYKFNEAKTKCIKKTSTQTAKPTNQKECEEWCSSRYGAGTPGIFFNDACACRCKEGYKLTAEGRKVKITIEQCDQLCLDQFGIGHRGVFSSDEMCKFVCEEGYTLNEAKTRCVKISPTKRPQTPAPTYSYDDTYAYDEVPGFELAFAIAGLLAVAYLLRRRK